tara:strand:+ start:120 stop:374 length:255 start_codon:yes stop_codon:yes gene_type:complete
MAEKSIEDIYRDIENEVEEDCFDREDIRLKDQEPYVMLGKSVSGNILLKVGDDLGYDVSKSLNFPEALKLINDLTVAVINRYAK